MWRVFRSGGAAASCAGAMEKTLIAGLLEQKLFFRRDDASLCIQAWSACGFPVDTTTSFGRAFFDAKIFRSDIHHKSAHATVTIHFLQHATNLLRWTYYITHEQFCGLLHRVFIATKWHLDVKTLDDIPSAVLQSVRLHGSAPLETYWFPNLANKNEISQSLPLTRLEHLFSTLRIIRYIEKEPAPVQPLLYTPGTSNNLGSLSSVTSASDDAEHNIFLPDTRFVQQTSDADSLDPTMSLYSGLHAYTLSLAVFLVADHLYRTLDGYFFTSNHIIYIWLRFLLMTGPLKGNSVLFEVPMPTRGDKNPRRLLQEATGLIRQFFFNVGGGDETLSYPSIPNVDELYQLLRDVTRFFGGDKLCTLLRNHQQRRKKSLTGDFVPCTRISWEVFYRTIVLEERQPVDSQCYSAENPIIYQFSRDLVSPLRLMTNVKHYQSKLFTRYNRVYTASYAPHMVYTRSNCYLILHPQHAQDVELTFSHYMAVQSAFPRRFPLPIWPTMLREYYYGDRPRLRMWMKSILRLFTSSPIRMPTEPTDPAIESYRLLHIILARFPSLEAIREALQRPYRDARVNGQMLRKDVSGEPFGFVDQESNIYNALRAMAEVHWEHVIHQTVVEELHAWFIEHPETQRVHPVQWGLIRLLNATVRGDDMYVNIPCNPERYYVYPFDVHIPLYYLCCSPYISNDLAVKTFINIGVRRGKERMAAMNFSTPIPGRTELNDHVRYRVCHNYETLLPISHPPQDVSPNTHIEIHDIEHFAFGDVVAKGAWSLPEVGLYTIEGAQSAPSQAMGYFIAQLELMAFQAPPAAAYLDQRLSEEPRPAQRSYHIPPYRGAPELPDITFIDITTQRVLEKGPVAAYPISWAPADRTPHFPSTALPLWFGEVIERDEIFNPHCQAIQEPRPFFQSAPNLLEDIILYPITRVIEPADTHTRPTPPIKCDAAIPLQEILGNRMEWPSPPPADGFPAKRLRTMQPSPRGYTIEERIERSIHTIRSSWKSSPVRDYKDKPYYF